MGGTGSLLPVANAYDLPMSPSDYDIRRIEVIDDQTAEMFRRMTPGERIRLGLGAYATAKRMAEAGVRDQHPEWSDAQVHDEVIKRIARAAG